MTICVCRMGSTASPALKPSMRPDCWLVSLAWGGAILFGAPTSRDAQAVTLPSTDESETATAAGAACLSSPSDCTARHARRRLRRISYCVL